MAKLPYSRVVNVTMTRVDAFPTRRGFGTVLFLQSKAVAGKVDSTIRTKLYGSLEEVKGDFLVTDQAYLAASYAFAQNPRPLQFKVAYYNATTATTKQLLKDELDLIYAYDTDWYFVTHEAALRDNAIADGIAEWVQAKNKLAILDSNAATMTNPADTANIAYRLKGTVDRTAVFWHNNVAHYGAVALAAWMGSRDFDTQRSAYTAKFKKLYLLTPVNIASAALTAVTGYTPSIGQSQTNGHLANTYIDIGDKQFVVEGSMLTQNVFLDEIHATDWIIARTEEEALGILLNNAVVPYTDQGMEQIASAARTVMNIANQAGLIANDLDENGDYSPAVIFDVPSVFSVPASQRKMRVAPPVDVRFRYAGAIHYTTIRYTMTF